MLLEEPEVGAPVGAALAHYDNRVLTLEDELTALLRARSMAWVALRAAPEHRREAMRRCCAMRGRFALAELQRLLPAELAREWHALCALRGGHLSRTDPRTACGVAAISLRQPSRRGPGDVASPAGHWC